MAEPDEQNKQQRQQAIRLTVAKDGSSGYDTVGAVLEALGDKKRPLSHTFIKEGMCRERLEIRRPGITLEGQSVGGTIATGGLSTRMTMEDGSKRGTFRTYSMLVDTRNFTAGNLTIKNSVGPGEAAGQVLALYTDGDRILLKGCRLLRGQDILSTGPPFLKEIQKNGFIGLKQFPPRINGHRYYQDCSIRGDVDFIFGSTTAYFDRCELYSAGRDTEKRGYITAASTPKGQKYGYMLRNCRSTGNSSYESVYLGRSWRDYARTVLTDCYLEPHVRREGRRGWDKKSVCSALSYGEYGSYEPGAEEQEAAKQGERDYYTSKPDWVFTLTHGQIQDYTME